MKMAKGTHKSMGKKSGVKAGLESGVSEVMSFKTDEGQMVNEDSMNKGTQRAKPENLGSIAVK